MRKPYVQIAIFLHFQKAVLLMPDHRYGETAVHNRSKSMKWGKWCWLRSSHFAMVF